MTGLIVGMRDVPCQLEGTTSSERYTKENWKIVVRNDTANETNTNETMSVCFLLYEETKATAPRSPADRRVEN